MTTVYGELVLAEHELASDTPLADSTTFRIPEVRLPDGLRASSSRFRLPILAGTENEKAVPEFFRDMLNVPLVKGV